MISDITRFKQYNGKSVIGQLICLLIGIEILVLVSFIYVPTPISTSDNSSQVNNIFFQLALSLPDKMQEEIKQLHDFGELKPVKSSFYVAQAPTAIFIGYVLGIPIGVVATFLFVLTGLLGPTFGVYLFAEGGGWEYFGQPSAGYLIGLITASWIAGFFASKKRTSLNQITMIILALLSVHGIGLLYMVCNVLVWGLVEGNNYYPSWANWLSGYARNLSWYPFIWDIVFSIILIGLAFPFKWLVSLLVSPDMFVNPDKQANPTKEG